MKTVRLLGLAFCLMALASMVACAFGPIGNFHDAALRTPVGDWAAGDWVSASLGFVLGWVVIPLSVGWAALLAVH